MSTGGVSAGGLGGLTASAGATPLPNSAASDSAGCNLGASKRTLGQGCVMRTGGSHRVARRFIRSQFRRVRWLRRRSARYQCHVAWVRKAFIAGLLPGTA